MDRAKILVVDDSERTRKQLIEILRPQGFSVHDAPDGEKAWTILIEDPLFDLVITDLNMPVIDGLDLLRRIRERLLPLEVILLTGWPADWVVARAQELGAFAVLAKPFGEEELVRTVRRALAKQFSVRRDR